MTTSPVREARRRSLESKPKTLQRDGSGFQRLLSKTGNHTNTFKTWGNTNTCNIKKLIDTQNTLTKFEHKKRNIGHNSYLSPYTNASL